MKNITVSVDEETYRLSLVRAAVLGTSVSALVRSYLRSLVHGEADGQGEGDRLEETEAEQRRRLFNEVFADFDTRGVGLHMADNVARDALYGRNAPR